MAVARLIERREQHTTSLRLREFTQSEEGDGQDVGVLLLGDHLAEGGKSRFRVDACDRVDHLLPDTSIVLLPDRDERSECFWSMRFAQGDGGFRSHRIVGVLSDHRTEQLDAPFVGTTAESVGRDQSAHHVVRVDELSVQHRIREAEFDSREDRDLRVDPHDFRSLGKGEIEISRRFVDADLKVMNSFL